MERLTEDLAGVVIDDQSESDPRELREERSRSTWAQVVSDDGEDRRGEDHRAPISYGGNLNANHLNRPEGIEEIDDGWQPAHKKHPKTPKKVHMDRWNSYKLPPNDQEYAKDVDDTSNLEPFEDELFDLSRACNKLWELDFNRLVPGKDYKIDCGDGKKVYNKSDMAEETLFTWLGDDVLSRPTISRFFALLDNYNPHQGYKEVVTHEEEQEQAAFVEEISRTAPIKYLYKYLSSKNVINGGFGEFKELMTSLWFGIYGRGGTAGSSSAFEHVFVGEIKSRGEEQVSGFHNWIQFYLEEAKGRVNYHGYILPHRRGEFPDSETHLLTIQFEWNGALKSVSSSFIGVSPEFEMALYTLCFFVGGEDNKRGAGSVPCQHQVLSPWKQDRLCLPNRSELTSKT